MSAGEVERLVSELSGGTGGDEEEEWLYGGTELPVPSVSPGFSQASPPGAQTVVLWGPSRLRLGPLLQNLVRPKSGPAWCARSPARLGLLSSSSHPQYARSPPRRGRTGVWGAGLGPKPRPSQRRGFSAASPLRAVHASFFFISILSSVGVSLQAPWL